MTTNKEGVAVATGAAESKVNQVAGAVLRYGLVLVIGWIGLLKFASYAHGIQPLVAHSPFMSWLTTSSP
jgi:reactive chlorine resistance protein C